MRFLIIMCLMISCAEYGGKVPAGAPSSDGSVIPVDATHAFPTIDARPRPPGELVDAQWDMLDAEDSNTSGSSSSRDSNSSSNSSRSSSRDSSSSDDDRNSDSDDDD